MQPPMQVLRQSSRALILRTNVVLRREHTRPPGKCSDKRSRSERNVPVNADLTSESVVSIDAAHVMRTTLGAKAPAVHVFFGAQLELNAASLNTIGKAGAAAAQCVRCGPNCRCRPSISFPPASGSRTCAASGRSPSHCVSMPPRSPPSTPRRLPSIASSPRARPSTASTPDSACSPGRASTTRGSRSCSARSCCRTPPAPEPLLDEPVVRLVVALKAASLARGHSGVRWSVIEALVALVNAGVVPVHSRAGLGGRLGRPGAARASFGGADRRRRGRARRARHAGTRGARARRGLAPVTLGPKEGLALLNGTQVSTALALAGLFAAERALAAAFVAGALSIDACLGSDTPFDARIHAVRGHRGQAEAAAVYRASAGRQRDPRVAQGLPARAGPLQPALPAAGDGRVRRPDAARGRDARDRSERGVGQSAGVRGHRRDPVRRQLPCRARRVRGGQSRARDRRDRRAVGAADRAPDGRQPVRPAAVPGRGRRRQFRLHDRAGHGRGARLGEQVARASGLGRLAADVRESGGSCQHGDFRGATADADGGEYGAHRRHRAARRRAGRRPAAAAGDLAEARRGDGRDPRRCAVLGPRPRVRAGSRGDAQARRARRLRCLCPHSRGRTPMHRDDPDQLAKRPSRTRAMPIA